MHGTRPSMLLFFFNDTATTEIYTLSLHDALPISTGGGALVIGFYLPGKFEALATSPPAGPAALNAWVRIAHDNTVTLIIDKSEMGTGVTTSLPMLLAEELEFDWKKVKFEFAPAATQYFNPIFGLQGTGGSTSVRASWEPLTKAGAARSEERRVGKE